MYFSKTTIECENVTKAISEFAKQNQIKTHEIDYKLLEYNTLYKKNTGDLTRDFSTLSEEEQEEIARTEALIWQTYKIELYPAERIRHDIIILSFVSDKYQTSLSAIVSKSSKIYLCDELEEELYEFFIKKKLSMSVMIGVFDPLFQMSIDDLAQEVREHKKLTKDFTIKMAHFPAPVMPRDDAIIFRYLDSKKYTRKGDKRLYYVNQGSILIEYIGPKEGKNGRDYRGEGVHTPLPKKEHLIKYRLGSGVEEVPTEDGFTYVSKNEGYVTIEEGRIDVDNELSLQQISQKETGSIDFGVDSEMEIDVSLSDAALEAVDSSMVVKSNRLNVAGNVAQGAHIETRSVKIDGQTHKDSFVKSDEALINIHRGYFEGSTVKINKLEGGFVKADYVEINDGLRGEIKGKEVKVTNLFPGVKIFASSSIYVQNFKNEGASLVIDYDLNEIEGENIESLLKNIENYENDKIKLAEKIKRLDFLVNRDFALVKGEIEKYKKIHGFIPEGLKRRLAATKEKNMELNSLNNSYTEVSSKSADSKRKITALKDGIEQCNVASNGNWGKLTFVSFVSKAFGFTLRIKARQGDLKYALAKDGAGYKIIRAE